MEENSQPLPVNHEADAQAANQLLPLVYDQLRELAAQRLAHEKPGQTLDATALVHEAYLRLVSDQRFANRRHFFAAAAESMRRILVENARRKQREKHGGDLVRHDVLELNPPAPEQREDLLALDEALDQLAAGDRQAADLVELRYFAGLTLPEAAEALAISPRSADRLWTYARAWLHRRLHAESS